VKYTHVAWTHSFSWYANEVNV